MPFVAVTPIARPDPEVQLDRIAVKLEGGPYLRGPGGRGDRAAVVAMREAVRAVNVERGLARYVIDLVDATRRHGS